MDFSPSALFASLLVSSVGFALLRYGKKQARAPQLIVGLLLTVGPYFVATAALTYGLAAVAIGGLWWAVRMGW